VNSAPGAPRGFLQSLVHALQNASAPAGQSAVALPAQLQFRSRYACVSEHSGGLRTMSLESARALMMPLPLNTCRGGSQRARAGEGGRRPVANGHA
jgi:hypothetical protein